MSKKLAICPLFYFQISEALIGKPKIDPMEYFTQLRTKLTQGIELSENVKLRYFIKNDFDKIRSGHWNLGVFNELFAGIEQVKFVLEFLNKDINDVPFVEEKISQIILAMRLHKAIPVFTKMTWYEEDERIKSISLLAS